MPAYGDPRWDAPPAMDTLASKARTRRDATHFASWRGAVRAAATAGSVTAPLLRSPPLHRPRPRTLRPVIPDPE